MWQSYMNGLLVALGLIMAIGSQNAFVLAQSLRRESLADIARMVARSAYVQLRESWWWLAGASALLVGVAALGIAASRRLFVVS